jgi:shikimate kinase
MKATALCHGAASIVTAFATGKGGAYGIGLKNRTSVDLDGSGTIESNVNGKDGVGVALAEAAVRRTLERFGVEYSGAKVSTESDIPYAAGLKSSSVAANAIVLATAAAVAKERGEVRRERLTKSTSRQAIIVDGREVTAQELIDLGIDAAFDAKVTVTGALDDASAAYLGGYTLTDNLKRRIIYHGGMEGLTVLIHLPDNEIHSADIDASLPKALAKEVDLVWEEARMGRIYAAITLNGLIHSAAFGLSPEAAVLALKAGAIAAGLSGTGPATVALARDGAGEIKDAWSGLGGRILETRTNGIPAEVMP